MYDTMTMTKLAASFCGALLAFLLVAWASESLFHTGVHGEPSFVIAVDEAPATEEVVEEVPFAEVFEVADASAGEGLWRQCQACHKLDGTDGVGPHLNGVVGRDIAAIDGFGYSSALADLDGAWTPEELNAFLEKPRDYAPGTAMSYNGMRDIEDRADLIKYLEASS
ncbi:MAG: cytochrome c family protein [Rhodobacteraceae bacterium]|nr:cytochrome c family protein [Paracoccaceae bacterium]